MKTAIILILTVAVSIKAQDTNFARPKVAVVAFENLTTSRQWLTLGNPALTPSRLPILGSDPTGNFKVNMGLEVERYSEMARSLFEAALIMRPEIEVVERKRVELIQREVDLNRARGGRRYADEQGAKRHGADFLVIGEMLSAWSETSMFEGYGLSLKTESTSVQIGVRVIKLAPETVVLAFTRTGTVSESSTPYFHATHSDRLEAAIREAISQLVENSGLMNVFVEKIRGANVSLASSTDKVKATFKTEGASVEIDGRYIGVAPCKHLLGRSIEYRVRLTKPGFKPWEGRIAADSALTVAPLLEAVSAGVSISTNVNLK